MNSRPAHRFPGRVESSTAAPDPPHPAAADITLSRTIARFMDDLVVIPGTNFGIGLDSLVGLMPGIGDATGTALSGAIMVDAIRVRVPVHVLLRMGWNLVLDTVLGILPFVGDMADVAHRANRKNLRLLERAVAQGNLVPMGHRTYLLRAVGILVVSIGICLAGAALSLWLLWRVLFG